MSDLYNQIMSQRGSLERLAARIPGFEGYMDRNARRAADRMLRDYLANALAQRINRLAQIEKTLLDGGGLQYMSETRSAKTKLQTFHDRVRAAAPGYAGLDDAIKIEQEELERLYSFDEAQLRYLDRFDEALNALEQAVSSKTGVEAAIAALDKAAVEAIEAFSLREDVLTNLGKSK
jgi:hypothetical protein